MPIYKNMVNHIDINSLEEDEIYNTWEFVDLLCQSSSRITIEHKRWCGNNTIGNWYWEQGPHWDAIFFQLKEDAIAFRLTWL